MGLPSRGCLPDARIYVHFHVHFHQPLIDCLLIGAFYQLGLATTIPPLDPLDLILLVFLIKCCWSFLSDIVGLSDQILLVFLIKCCSSFRSDVVEKGNFKVWFLQCILITKTSNFLQSTIWDLQNHFNFLNIASFQLCTIIPLFLKYLKHTKWDFLTILLENHFRYFTLHVESLYLKLFANNVHTAHCWGFLFCIWVNLFAHGTLLRISIQYLCKFVQNQQCLHMAHC